MSSRLILWATLDQFGHFKNLYRFSSDESRCYRPPTMQLKPDPYSLKGVKRHQKPRLPWLTVSFGLVAVILAALILTPYPEKIRRKVGLGKSPVAPVPVKQAKQAAVQVEPNVIIKEKIVKVNPPYYQGQPGTRIAKTRQGYDFKATFEERVGKLASDERESDGSYEVAFSVVVNRPTGAKTMEELMKVNPKLDQILPGLADLAKNPRVSPFFEKLYTNKAKRLESKGYQTGELLTKHNYYDCQTMLEMEDPESKRKVFLIQADMDVVADGSDGDRLATMPDSIVNSTHYQPFTSYGWKKTGTVENPMIAGWRKQVATEKAKSSPSSATIQRLERGIEDLKRRSFLIAEYDPFIVIPVDMITDRESSFGPNVGDYAVVIHEEQVFPAIVGDGGPTFKVGEGSLRLSKAINERATPYNRPVSSVGVTYLIFPRSSTKWQAPNYEEWRTECEKLLKEVGGLGEGYVLHQWENTLPQPEPEPEEAEAEAELDPELAPAPVEPAPTIPEE